MKRALLVSYVFPPMAAVGGLRVLYFCRHLRTFGWEPVVLTIKQGANVSYDPSLLDKIPDVKIYRSTTFEPLLRRQLSQASVAPPDKPENKTTAKHDAPRSRSPLGWIRRWVKLALSVPDHAIFWVPFGVAKGLRVIRREKPEVLFSSSPPVSSHIVASILSRLTGLPHVVDFRDLWTLNHLYEQRLYPRLVRAYDRFWERFVLRRAAAVVTASPGFTRQMSEYAEGQFTCPIVTITNGFDYEEFKSLKVEPRAESGKVRFLYLGSLYADFNPSFFFEGLATWLERSRIDRSTVSVDFYGNSGFDYGDWLVRKGLSNVVSFHGFRSRADLVPLLLQADCLLLFLGFNEQVKNVIPAKLFEYLASGAAVLAIAPKGVTSELIDQYQAGFCIDRPDKELLIATLQKIYDARRSSTARREFRYMKEIDRVHLTQELASLFDRITARDADSRPVGVDRA